MKIVLINLDKDRDRLRESESVLKRFGLSFERIPGVVNKDREKGFSLAMINALTAIPNGGMIMEDDIELKEYRIPRLPDNWDMLYLGANLNGRTERVSRDLVRVFSAYTTHAVLYADKAVKKILSEYDYDKHGVYDKWLADHFLRENNCYMVTPMQAYQRRGYSSILGHNVDYSVRMNMNYQKYVE